MRTAAAIGTKTGHVSEKTIFHHVTFVTFKKGHDHSNGCLLAAQ